MIFAIPPLPPQPPTVIVWIHGTKPELPPAIAQLVHKISHLPFLFDSQKGLRKATDLDVQHYPFMLTQALSQTNPTQFPLEHMYTFGWSGELSPEARKKASCELFYSLKDLVLSLLEEYGCMPNIILISHSHGGNVILHMAEIDDPDDITLTINKAILLACPVQKNTTHLTEHPMFERIYSLHSHTDMIQIADPQGLHKHKKISRPLLSERHFDINPKIAQACIRWKKGPILDPKDNIVNYVLLKPLTKAIDMVSLLKKNRGLFHVEFKLLPFIRQLPAIITQLDNTIDKMSHYPIDKNQDIIIEL